MSSRLDKAIKDFIQIIREAGNKGTSPLDAQAEVLRIDEDGTAWVHLPGGVDETPVKLTINAEVGDKVYVRLSGGRAWITGNQTAPPTDDKTAVVAKSLANIAGNQAKTAQKTADQAQVAANSALKGTKENAAQMAQMVVDFNGDIANLQDQIDGNISTWFYDVDPAMGLPPVTDWDTDEKKDAHLGDIYYNTAKGYAWRFMKSGSTYSWERITDTDVTKALADAAKAQDTADSKRRVFYNTPTVPYDAGDLWVQGSGGDILRCAQAKTSTGSYDRNDWVLASKYTDDSALTTWIEGDFATTIQGLEEGLADAKVETYYQTTDPSTGWSDTQKSEHEGDLWYNSTESVQKYYRWSGTAWQELTATPPQAVFDSIDKKATIYTGTTTPTNPDSGDLWFKGADEPILTYVNNSWVEYNKYTDDSAVNNLEIGGRNYVVKKDRYSTTANGITVDYNGDEYHVYGTNTKTNANYSIGNWVRRYNIFEPGAVYTVSTTTPLPSGLYLGINTRDSSGTEIRAGSNSYFFGNGSKTSNTFTCTQDTNGYLYGFFGIEASCRTIDVTFKIKLEKGNKATDWTPAPEDIDAGIANAAKTATNYIHSDTTNGLVVNNNQNVGVGYDIQLKADGSNTGMNIRQNGNILASFLQNQVSLGKNSINSKVGMCGDKGGVSASFGYYIDSVSSTNAEMGSTLSFDFNETTFKNKVGQETGFYHFTYTSADGWKLFDPVNDTSYKVTLAQYGITMKTATSSLNDYAQITVNYVLDGTVKFYNADISNPIRKLELEMAENPSSSESDFANITIERKSGTYANGDGKEHSIITMMTLHEFANVATLQLFDDEISLDATHLYLNSSSGEGSIQLDGDTNINGELTIGTALSIANGGTGATSLVGAQENLGIKAISERIDNLILGTGTSPVEVQDARLSSDGTRYPTLKSRLDAENSELKSDVSNHLNGFVYNEINFTVVPGAYVDNKTGAFVVYEGWDRTDYIEVDVTKDLFIESAVNMDFCATYDENKTFIRSLRISTGLNYLYLRGDEKYVALSTPTGNLAKVKIWNTDMHKVNGSVNKGTDFSNNLINVPWRIGSLDSNGAYSYTSSRLVSDHIELPYKGAECIIELSSTWDVSIAEYDENKEFIFASQYLVFPKTTRTLSANTKFIRMIVYDRANTSANLKVGDIWSSGISVTVTGLPHKLKVMSYNLGHYAYGTGTGMGLPANIYDEKLIAYRKFIGEELPDICGFQEYDSKMDEENTILATDVLWGHYYPHKYITDSQTALFAKKLISWGGTKQLSTGRYYTEGTMNGIYLISVHPSVGADKASTRIQECTEVINIVKQYERYIIFGDFNCEPNEEDSLFKLFTDEGMNIANCGWFGKFYTWSSNSADFDDYENPTGTLWYIDNIITSPNINITNVYPVPKAYSLLSSDHIPIIAELEIN